MKNSITFKERLISVSGRIIGLALGFALDGYISGIIGFLIGYLYDINFFERIVSYFIPKYNLGYVHRVFFNATFKTMGYIAKCDGRVSPDEIVVAEKIMQRMELIPKFRHKAIRLFQLGKNPKFNIIKTLHHLKKICRNHQNLLLIFMDIQMQVILADHVISSEEKKTIELIGETLEISIDPLRYQEMGLQFGSAEQQLQNSYATLGVEGSVSDEILKKNYRRLMNQNHPDKLVSKGLPPEMMKIAVERTQKIHHAYQMIKKARQRG